MEWHSAEVLGWVEMSLFACYEFTLQNKVKELLHVRNVCGNSLPHVSPPNKELTKTYCYCP